MYVCIAGNFEGILLIFVDPITFWRMHACDIKICGHKNVCGTAKKAKVNTLKIYPLYTGIYSVHYSTQVKCNIHNYYDNTSFVDASNPHKSYHIIDVTATLHVHVYNILALFSCSGKHTNMKLGNIIGYLHVHSLATRTVTELVTER